ncbi:MAG: sugar phosphate isomerase/epimerase, partial [Armatimonadetes bacterium]|nr:sugar phosphate isomerase/epimerase [Armatimonadota bacterium]
MKLGFIAGTTLEQIEKDAAFAVEQGYRGLEFNYWAPFAELTDETVAAMRAILDRYQVECSTLGLWGWNHISADPTERKLAHEMLGRAIGYAGVLGAPV